MNLPLAFGEGLAGAVLLSKGVGMLAPLLGHGAGAATADAATTPESKWGNVPGKYRRKGKATQFGDDPSLGVSDPGNRGVANVALKGHHTTEAGIAVYRHDTLGGYWRVTIGKVSHVFRQIDVGPAPGTGAIVDLTPKAARMFRGFKGSGTAQIEYLGMSPP